MALQTFDFPYHRVMTKYPPSSLRVQFGRSYTFKSKPNAPDQRLFTLQFEGMKYYLDGLGVIDVTTSPYTNLAKLEAFYNIHKMSDEFLYPHPVYGDLVVVFSKPLEIPKGIKGGSGVVEDFELEFEEQP